MISETTDLIEHQRLDAIVEQYTAAQTEIRREYRIRTGEPEHQLFSVRSILDGCIRPRERGQYHEGRRKTMKSVIPSDTGRAVIRTNKTHIVVLCPIGHLIEAHKIDTTFGGSAFEAELAYRHPGDRFDRLAASCSGAGHKGEK